MKQLLKLFVIAMIVAMTTCCFTACLDGQSAKESDTENLTESDAQNSTSEDESQTETKPTYTLSFVCEGTSFEPLTVKEGELLADLYDIPAKLGYSAAWQIDGVAIDATSAYNYAEDKEAIAVYTANTDTPYSVSVYLYTDNGYENITANYDELTGLEGTTDAIVDITDFAQNNLPEYGVLNNDKSKLTGTVEADGSLELSVYYDFNVDFIFKSIADTRVALDFNTVYGEQKYSYKVQFHATTWNGTVSFKLNENAPVVPEGATHATFYVYTGHASYDVSVNALSKSYNFAQTENFTWQELKLTATEYLKLKEGVEITLRDANGNSQGKWLYLSSPVFTTEEISVFYGKGVVKNTDEVYKGDEYSYMVNGNSLIYVSPLLLEAMEDEDMITFYVKGTVSCPFNLVTYDPWDANTSLATTSAGEWVAVTLTRAQVEALVANPLNKYLQARIWEASTFYISATLDIPRIPNILSSDDTQTIIDKGFAYGEQECSYKVQFHATAWNGTVSFKLNENAPVAPEGATHATFYVYTGHASYNVILNMGREKNFAQTENFSWQEFKFTVKEYEALKGMTFTLQDPNGNSTGKWLYISQPVFTTEELDTFYGTGITKDTSVVYGDDSYSYKFEVNTSVLATERLLEILDDADNVKFYIKGTASCSFNLITVDPWDANTSLATTTVGEWVAVTLTRAQVEALVANPFNKFLQARIWEASTFYISEPEAIYPPKSIFSNVADTEVGVDTSLVYGDQEYSNKVQFHKTAWNGTVSFALNENAPEAPAGATHVTFYTYIGHTSYNVALTMGRSHNVAQNGGEWKPVKFTVAEYEVLKNSTFTLQDPNGNSTGKWLYLSAPVFTTEELDVFYGDGIEKDSDMVYGEDKFSYKFSTNTIVMCSAKLLEMLGDGNTITFYIKGTASCSFNLITVDPWDANTSLATTTVGEWVAVTLTRAQVEALVANPFNKYLQARIWDASTFYISSTLTIA